MLSALRSAFVFAFASAFVVLAMPGCSQQGEGERCDSAKNGDEDCESGLTCVLKSTLLDKTADRCCPPEGTSTNKRCFRGSATSTGGSGGGGATTGGTETGGTDTGGTDTGGTDTGGTDTGGTDTGGTDTGGTDSAGGSDAAGGGG
jgi:hypothetical protein